MRQAEDDVLAVIPARKGSKGLPGKNIKDLLGRPLVEWSIRQARASSRVSVVHVSTDCEVTADLSRTAGADVPYLRPGELATDEATTYSAIEYALDHYAVNGREFGYVVLVEPTSPLRRPDDIDRAVGLLIDRREEFDSLVTIGQVHEHPSIMKRFEDPRVFPWTPGSDSSARRQDLEPAWFPYGVAYVAKTGALREQRTFYTERCMGMPLERFQTYEIDDALDFLCVEAVMRHMEAAA